MNENMRYYQPKYHLWQQLNNAKNDNQTCKFAEFLKEFGFEPGTS